jgi:cytochrome c oxidase subunit 3
VGQLRAWQILVSEGYSMDSNPASAFFFLLTALHGIHLMGGLWVWTLTTVKAFYGRDLGDLRLSIELCAQYWHYLLILWLLLFALLKAT